MVDLPLPPFRHAFDAARDPLTARNALGITSTGGGGGGFITAVTAPLQVTGTTLSIDLSAYLTSATAAATYQPLDGDLTAIAALTGTNTIYYRSASNTWSAITVSTGLSFSGGVLTATGGGGTATITAPLGRLTLQASVPVMITTQSAKTTIYYTPYLGNFIPIHDGTNFVMTTFSEISVATSNTANSPAAIGASKVNDWFVWNDAGTLRLVHGPDWTSDTTRSAGTLLNYIAGYWTNSVAITNGPASNRGTYVGTTRSNASSQLDWIYGAIGAPPTAGFFGVWNAYNRVNVASFLGDTTATWTYALTTVREIRGDTTAIFTYVSGLAEEPFTATTFYTVQAGTAGFAITGVGYDATNAFSGASSRCCNISTQTGTFNGRLSTTSLGAHFMAACEAINSANSQTIVGSATNTQCGMFFEGKF